MLSYSSRVVVAWEHDSLGQTALFGIGKYFIMVHSDLSAKC